MQDMGPAMQCLGMLIVRSRKNRTLFVNQKAYLENVLKKFGMTVSQSLHLWDVLKKFGMTVSQSLNLGKLGRYTQSYPMVEKRLIRMNSKQQLDHKTMP